MADLFQIQSQLARVLDGAGAPGLPLPLFVGEEDDVARRLDDDHATRGGAVLVAGSVVTTGTWCGLLDAAEGDHVMAEFPGIGRAAVQL